MDYKLCTLLITFADGREFFHTCVLNGPDFRLLIAAGAALIEIIE